MSKLNIQELYQQSIEYFQEGSTELALKVAHKISSESYSEDIGFLEMAELHAGLGEFEKAYELLEASGQDIPFTKIQLSYVKFLHDQETYDLWFFKVLQDTKDIMFEIETRTGAYADKSDKEIDSAERFYFDELDKVNELDMKVRLGRVVYFG